MKLTNPKTINNFSVKSNSLNKQIQKKPKCSPVQLGNNDYIFNIAVNNISKYNEAILSKQTQSFSIDEKKIDENYFKDINNNKELAPILNNENYTQNLNNDKKLIFTLKTLDLENLFNEFNLNYISFHDLFLLTREDLIEMNIPIGPRNRILHFGIEFKKFSKNYDYNELKNFFLTHKGFIFNEIEDFEFDESINNNLNNYNINNNTNDITPISKQKSKNINSNTDLVDKNFYSFNIEQNNNIINLSTNNSFRKNNINNLSSPKSNNKSKKIIKEKKTNDIPIPCKTIQQNLKKINSMKKTSFDIKEDNESSLNENNDNINNQNKYFDFNKNENNDIDNNNISNDSSSEINQDSIKYNLVNDSSRKYSNDRKNKNSSKLDSNNKYINKSFNNSNKSTSNRTNSVQSNNSMSNINNSKINNQVLQNFENIFSEVENFQNQYKIMKEKNEERNNKINNLLNKKNTEIEKIKNQLIGNNIDKSNISNNKKQFENKNDNKNIIIDNDDLINESERNLNEELYKIYNENDMIFEGINFFLDIFINKKDFF